jgi:hypothetical protein
MSTLPFACTTSRSDSVSTPSTVPVSRPDGLPSTVVVPPATLTLVLVSGPRAAAPDAG